MEKSCSHPGCVKRRATGSGLCSMHKSRRARGMDMDMAERKAQSAECSVGQCPEPSHARELCKSHYSAAARDGSLARAYRIKRTATGCDHNGYLEVPDPQRPAMRRQHRIVMEAMLGRPLQARESVHHVNGRRRDNRPENLELWVKPQPNGQRVEDLVAWVVANYPDQVAAQLRARTDTPAAARYLGSVKETANVAA